MTSVEAHRVSIGNFYNRLKPVSNATKEPFTFRYDGVCSILLYLLVSLFYFPTMLHVHFALFILVTFDVVCEFSEIQHIFCS